MSNNISSVNGYQTLRFRGDSRFQLIGNNIIRQVVI